MEAILTRHPELVLGSIFPLARGLRGQPQTHRQVNPTRIFGVDLVDLPLPVPVLELLFARDGFVHRSVKLEIDQPVDGVFAGETGQGAFTMLPQARNQIGSDTYIERSVMAARKDIDARVSFLPHAYEPAARWTLKQVQGDEDGAVSVPTHSTRHAELVSASISPMALTEVAG